MQKSAGALPDRRKAFKKMGKWLLAGGGTLTVASFALGREGSIDEWVSFGPVTAFPVGEIQLKRVSVVAQGAWVNQRVEKGVWLYRNPDDTVTILSAVCPHKTYNIIRAESGAGTFFCPGHKSAFDSSGNVLVGPAPRPMDALEHKIENGVLMVRYQKFKSNIPAKEAFVTG